MFPDCILRRLSREPFVDDIWNWVELELSAHLEIESCPEWVLFSLSELALHFPTVGKTNTDLTKS